jgi:putative protein kinase ArgK-like GTPase of G3E family
MLHLAPERAGWSPAIVRTVATENQGITELATAISNYRNCSGDSVELRQRKIEHWKARLLTLAGEIFLERVVSSADGEATLNNLARAVANREKDPYSAVRELLKRGENARRSV